MFDELEPECYQSAHIGHLGLVADMINELDLINEIDKRLPISMAHGAKVTHGERVAAMILNGLGFIDTRLYLFPDFLSDKAVSRLFGRELEARWFNDDALGRTLDAISAYGSTKLMSIIAFAIGAARELLGKSTHLDTTTLTLHGDYEQFDNQDENPVPKRGYSKSGRHDLKQMILLLATTGASNFPIWMEAHSGNASDQKTLPSAAERMKKFCEELAIDHQFIYVGDSALYTHVLPHSDQLYWITRVPERIQAAKKLVYTDKNNFQWQTLTPNYQACEVWTTHQSVRQRWLMVFSQHAYDREIKTLMKKIDKISKEEEKRWWHLSCQQFSCKNDAEQAIKQAKKKLRYHDVTTKIEAVMGHASRGRPKADCPPQVVGYKITYELSLDDTKVEAEKSRKGRFILATNQLDIDQLSSQDILTEYKNQSGVERGFKFIKDDTFQVDSIFLKTPARIEALMMIMTLCLMTYGVTEYELRKKLAASQETILAPSGKPTQKPSLKWVYFLFRVVQEVHIHSQKQVKKIVVNVSSRLRSILKHFGPRAQTIYSNVAASRQTINQEEYD